MFGFPKAEEELKSSFNRNFLRTVIFQIKFDKTKELYKHKSEIHSILQYKYPRLNDNVGKNFDIKFNRNETPIITTSRGNGFNLKTNDGSSTLSFNEEQIDINITGNKYTNFKSISDSEIKDLKSIFLKFGIECVNRIAIRKINIIGLSIPSNNNLTQISKELLNEKLYTALDSFPMEENIIQNISNVNYFKGDYGLNLKSGHSLQPNHRSLGHLICDIDIFKSGETETTKIENIFQEINDEIFNIFVWFLNEKSLKILADE